MELIQLKKEKDVITNLIGEITDYKWELTDDNEKSKNWK